MHINWPNRKHPGWRHVPQSHWQPFEPSQVSLPSSAATQSTDFVQELARSYGISLASSWVLMIDGQVQQMHGQGIETLTDRTSWPQPDWPMDETLWSFNDQNWHEGVSINAQHVTLIEYYTGTAQSVQAKCDIHVPKQVNSTIMHHIISADNDTTQAIVQMRMTVNEQATLSYYRAHQHHQKRLGYQQIICHDHAAVTVHTLGVTGSFVKDTFHYQLADHVHMQHNHLDTSLAKNYHEQQVFMDLVGRNVTTTHTVRGIVADHAKSVHISQARVKSSAVDAVVKQKLDFRVMDKAHVVSQPDIIVGVDAVKAAHGSTIAPFDTTSLNYMQSRGLDKSQAMTLMTNAFAAPLLSAWSNVAPETVSAVKQVLATFKVTPHAS